MARCRIALVVVAILVQGVSAFTPLLCPRHYHLHPSSGRPRREATGSRLHVLPPAEAFDAVSAAVSSSVSTAAASIVGISPEPIHAAFSVATFLPQPFWLLMIVLPNNSLTKKVMGGLEVPLLCCLVHLFICVASVVLGGPEATAPLAEFNDVFDPAGDPQKAFMGMTTNYPNFVAEEWSHVLTWDLFIGRYIYLDGLKRGIFTAPAVLFANLIGPPGLLIHWLTCTISGKPIFDRAELEAIETESE